MLTIDNKARHSLEQLGFNITPRSTDQLERAIQGSGTYLYTRKDNYQVFMATTPLLPASDLIATRNANQSTTVANWTLERVIPQSENKIRRLTPGELELLQFLGPLAVVKE